MSELGASNSDYIIHNYLNYFLERNISYIIYDYEGSKYTRHDWIPRPIRVIYTRRKKYSEDNIKYLKSR